MSVYIYTGKLGGGKTLCAVARIKEKVEAGCPVATNLDLSLVNLLGPQARNVNVLRIPDKPTIGDLNLIGYGNRSYDESQNGLLVLDECGTWFNSRNWNDKARKPVNDWFLHARKFGWDVILIIQDIKLLDSQARDAIAEHTAFCRRLDRVQVPVIGSLYKAITGFRLTGPKLHVAKVVYGTSPDDLVADRHVYKGTALYHAYNTKQLFLADYPHGPFSYLTPWHTRGRYAVQHDWSYYMRMTKIYWKRLKAPAAMAIGAFFGVIISTLLVTNSDTATAETTSVVPDPQPLAAIDDTIGQSDDETTAERFGGYRLSAYMQSDSKALVTISNDEGSMYTGAQLLDLGYRVIIENNCTITIRALDFYDAHTITARNCVIRPYDRPAYDLSTLKNVPKFASTVDF